MIEVVPLLDSVGSFMTFREAFGVDDDAPWQLPFYAYLVRLGEKVVLVDTGVGPPGGEERFLPDREGRLPDELAAAGIAPADVDLVVFTHLHVDHVGWNMRDGEPFFPNARYIAQRADYEFFAETQPTRPSTRDHVVALHGTGALELLDGPAEPLPGLRLEPTGGHTPGHQLVALDGVTLLGDVAVHTLQLEQPDLPYFFEHDKEAIAATRRRLLPALAGTNVGFGHIPPGIL